ncbi:MAG TPA: hemerythrin domain-containing protein [Acidimicrobiia bacterium]|nr:hemerythrin domain-containing protein [Acidimicrobiia bacterium]
MTATVTDVPQLAATTAPLETVEVDLYGNIHKAIRGELFAVTYAAGNVDPSHDAALEAVVGRWTTLAGLLVSHAAHEDTFVGPVLEHVDRDLVTAVTAAHASIDAIMAEVGALADDALGERREARRLPVHRLHLALASFTATYLQHEEFEELVVMPALAARVTADELRSVHEAILASIPPDEMAMSLSMMLPAINVDERVEVLAGVRAGAPAEVFTGVLGLAQSVLTPDAYAQVTRRLSALG